MSLRINTNYMEEENIWLMDIIGEVDIYTANELKETLRKMLDEHVDNIKINCSELTYIDSTGLGVLIGALKRLKKENKNIIIVNPKQNISKLLKITGLNKIFILEGE
ncbi:STAS domain-containing protein [Crassaminicella thermophila]|uniref:Anti-sigma factor antagonist n=1 Tax=Crassaminicella thermophila TaxID=2599308 RepID=A0A5C0SD95_CRATE|nr:STAS domain-containing protein [Crassaminicella thermophila]QEK10889.1 STAS domain-containing protein [Crassaminicella thermophila]